MLTGFKRLFSRKMEYPVETYGKLPCYKDYISIVTTDGAVQWRSWLLEIFQGKCNPPAGVWRFIYQHRKDSDPVVGIILASSDGLRLFPFSLFTVCRKASGQNELCPQLLAVSIWQQLEDIYRSLLGVTDIQDLYAQLYGRKLSPSPDDVAYTGQPGCFYHGRGEWPQILIADPRNSGLLYLVKEGATGIDTFLRNWQQLVVSENFSQPLDQKQDDITEQVLYN